MIPLPPATLLRASLRTLGRRRALTLLQLAGIAVGVASAVGMALSARTAVASFERAVGFLQGQATHALSRPAGGLEETLLPRLAEDPAVAAFSPVLDRRVELAGGEKVRVLGIDPFLDRRLRPAMAPTEDPGLAFLLEPRAVLADANLAARLAGPELATSHGPLTVVGTFPSPSAQPLLLLDIGHAQRLFGSPGRVDRVDLILGDPEGFIARWGPGFQVRSSGQRRAATGDLLRAFRLNLQALSLLGLFVGVFLVYNTATFAVVSRRAEAAVLRSLGAGRGQVAGAFAVEFLVLGGLGGLLGAALGFALSGLLTEMLGGTISSLYFFLRPAPPVWSSGLAVQGVLLGWAACALGAAAPLAELLRADPARSLAGRGPRRRTRARADGAACAGAAVLALSAALLPVASRQVYAGFAAAFGLLLGASLTSGAVLWRLGPALARAGRAVGGLPGRLAADHVTRDLGRTAVAVAAFSVALATAVGLGLMIDSFRATMVWWMEGQLTGQVYIAPSAEVDVPLEVYEQVRAVGDLGVDPYHNETVLYRDTPVQLSAVSAATLQRYARFAWVDGGRGSWDRVREGEALVSESFWRRFGVGRGDVVELPAPGGAARLPVAGVFYDYTTEHGLVMVDRATYLKLYGDPTIDSLGLFTDPANPDHSRQLAEAVHLAEAAGLPAVPRGELYGRILEVFDATFAVTRSMRVLAVGVALCGIAGALLTLVLERRRELGVLRALGFSPGQVAAATLLEGAALGAVSLGLALVLGSAVAQVLIRVINLGSFHWTVFFRFGWGPYLSAAATAALASLAAAAYPAWRVWRSYPRLQLWEE